MTTILAAQSTEMRAKAETMLQQADRLLCESWNERMWADGGPINPSPTIDRAINGGYPWLEIESRETRPSARSRSDPLYQSDRTEMARSPLARPTTTTHCPSKIHC